MNSEGKRRPPDPATRRPRPKKPFEVVEAKGVDADRYPWFRAFRSAKLPLNVKAVGFVMASYGTKAGADNHPGLARLARDLDVDEKTVRRHLEMLERAGWVRRTHEGRAGMSRKDADDYQLTIPQGVGTVSADGDGALEEPPEWLDEEPDPDGDQWTKLSTSPGDQWTIYDRPVDKIVQTPRTLPTENHGAASCGGVASATPNGSHRDRDGIPADAVTATRIPSQRAAKKTKPQRLTKPPLSEHVAPDDRARCNHYIGLLAHLDDDDVNDGLWALWEHRERMWVWAYGQMRKKFGGAPLPKPYVAEDAGYVEPDTPEQARYMYEKGLRLMSRESGWHESLTEPLKRIKSTAQLAAEPPPWAA